MLSINVKLEFSKNCGELIAWTISIDAAQINGNANSPNGLHWDNTGTPLHGYYFHFALEFYFTLNTMPLLRNPFIIVEQ